MQESTFKWNGKNIILHEIKILAVKKESKDLEDG
jgi:hypothetical protein